MLNQQIIHALGSNLDCNFARLKCFALLISAVLRHRTVNLTILATTRDGKTCSNESRYRRFQDFFLRFPLCLHSVGKCVLERIPKPMSGYSLAMDRTNWKFGKCHINYLTIGIVVGKVSIPIVWKVLPQRNKRGNSNVDQRIELTRKLLKLIPACDIHDLTMDREFNGKKWLTWLNDQGVAYVLRIKKNVLIGGKSAYSHAKSRGRKPSERQNVFGLSLFFSCKKMKKGGRDTHLLLVSNSFQGKEALKLYKRRWGIERLFGHLKKKGFDLEATHMTKDYKLETLFAVVTLAFTYSYAWGCHLRKSGVKTNATSKRKSLFRLGLEDILNMIQPIASEEAEPQRLREFVSWLSQSKFESIFLV